MARAKKEQVVEQEPVVEQVEEQIEEQAQESQEGIGPDDPIFEGGPTNNMVAEWKSRYGEIYANQFDEEVFIWRPINRVEYKEIFKVKNADGMWIEERICEKCVLWPENYSFMDMSIGKAGIPSTLSNKILDMSGFLTNDPIRL